MADLIKENKMFGGFVKRYRHDSKVLSCPMHFTIFVPPGCTEEEKAPIIYFLSGLTCTDENFMQKSGAQRKAAELKVALVTPDTSPRGHNVEGESDSWDFGVGAGFYLNATEEKWKHWKMYDYIISELPQVLKSLNLLIEVDWCSIMGHSMGGHGALTLALKNPYKFRSVSAFAPICNPTQVPWGQKAFSGYLGDDNKESWREYDATELALKFEGDNCPSIPILMDTGTNDEFLKTQLHPWAFEEAVKKSGKISLESRMQEGYDHSYFFIASFIEDHVQFHAFYLNQGFW